MAGGRSQGLQLVTDRRRLPAAIAIEGDAAGSLDAGGRSHVGTW
jgi:hypothetical protein